MLFKKLFFALIFSALFSGPVWATGHVVGQDDCPGRKAAPFAPYHLGTEQYTIPEAVEWVKSHPKLMARYQQDLARTFGHPFAESDVINTIEQSQVVDAEWRDGEVSIDGYCGGTGFKETGRNPYTNNGVREKAMMYQGRYIGSLGCLNAITDLRNGEQAWHEEAPAPHQVVIAPPSCEDTPGYWRTSTGLCCRDDEALDTQTNRCVIPPQGVYYDEPQRVVSPINIDLTYVSSRYSENRQYYPPPVYHELPPRHHQPPPIDVGGPVGGGGIPGHGPGGGGGIGGNTGGVPGGSGSIGGPAPGGGAQGQMLGQHSRQQMLQRRWR